MILLVHEEDLQWQDEVYHLHCVYGPHISNSFRSHIIPPNLGSSVSKGKKQLCVQPIVKAKSGH